MLAAVCALALLSCFAVTASAQIVLTHINNAIAPTPGVYDISNIVAATGTVPQTAYSNDNGFAGTGQSFTLGTDSRMLNSFSIKGGGNGITNSALWNIALYQVGEGNALTLITSASALTDQSAPYFHPEANDWVTFSFTGANAVTLSANTQYVFQVSTTSEDNSFFGFAQANNMVTSAPAGGHGVAFNALVPNSTTATDLSYNYIFDIGLSQASAVPEPSMYALVFGGCVIVLAGARRRARSG